MTARALAWSAGVVAFAIGIVVASADRPGKTATGFDHNLHTRDVYTSGGDPIACTKCHTIQNGALVGRTDHAACFGVCHGGAPPRGKKGTKPVIAPEQMRVCVNCHAEAALVVPFTGKLAVPFPPYPPTDFALEVAHEGHAAVACTQCHLPAKTAPHRRCLTCHDGSGAAGRSFAMTTCAPCHSPGSGTPLPPKLAEPVNTPTTAFSHQKHAQRGGRGAECTICHAAIRETNDSILPRPKAQTCATTGCHDGAPVFPITSGCTKCHDKAPAKYDVKRRDVRFSHATHKDTGFGCITCHPLGKTGEVLTVGHAPCATCHAEDFTLRDPQYCRACHNSSEPWRKLVADRSPADRTEFGATLDHQRAPHRGDCTTCHSLRTPGSQLRPPRGHRACTGSTCHAVGSGPTPQFASCDGCHRLGLAATRDSQRTSAAWSVRTTFEHATHARGKTGNDIACASCHVDLSGSSIAALVAPTKATCVPCHDGGTAFKLTGTGCVRCHPGDMSN